MRFARVPKFAALLFAATLLSAAMADAGLAGEGVMKKAQDTFTEFVEEGVTVTEEKEKEQEAVVGEQRTDRGQEPRSRKPRMATRGVQQTWKECVGLDVEQAVDMIRTARPDLKKVVKVPEGSMVTMDLRMDRVRVYYNTEKIVTRPPRVG